MIKDLTCGRCGEHEAGYLMYFRKIQPESGGLVFFDPSLICEDCKNRFGSGAVFDDRPVIISFVDLAAWPDYKVGWLLSKKGKEANALNVKFWRDKVWRIRFVTKKEI